MKDGGISGPWSTQGREPVGLPVLPSPGAGEEPNRAAPQSGDLGSRVPALLTGRRGLTLLSFTEVQQG